MKYALIIFRWGHQIRSAHSDPMGMKEKKTVLMIFFSLISPVAGLGVGPSLGDYEPPVRPYTTPR